MTGTHIQHIIITRFLIDPQADDQRVVTVALGNNRSAMRIVESSGAPSSAGTGN